MLCNDIVIGNAEVTESKEFNMNTKGENLRCVCCYFENILLSFCSDTSWYANLCIVVPWKQGIVFHMMKD